MMRRRTFVAMAAAAGTALVAPARGFAQADASAGDAHDGDDPANGYAPVNGLQMYYEIHGSGEPLVLLHGAFGAIDLWGPILTTLAETHQVIAVEQQGHGHTADIDRPFSYEQMADDVAALMEHLAIAQADIVRLQHGRRHRAASGDSTPRAGAQAGAHLRQVSLRRRVPGAPRGHPAVDS